MTKIQIKNAMNKTGIVGEITGRGNDWEVELKNDKEMKKFCREVFKVGGYKTGYGGWVLSPNYQSQGEYNDKASRWHY